MESDKCHIHPMIETTLSIKLSDLVRTMKSYITYHIWLKNEKYLKNHFWGGERTFWSDGYFIVSIGQASEESIKNYIINQGKEV